MKAELDTQVTLQVPFHDVDMMEIVWHGHFAKYLEIARCALLDRFDFDYGEMAKSGYAWPVVELRIKYVKTVHFGQTIRVKAKLAEYENRLKIDYVVSDAETGDRLAKGYTVQVAVDRKTGELCLVSPPVLLQRLGVEACGD